MLHVLPSPAFLTSLAASLGGAPVHDTELEREAAEMWLEEQIHGRENAEIVLLEGHPAEAAVDWAREAGCDVMVAAHHSGRVERVLLGSFAKHLVDHAPCAVFLHPTRRGGLTEGAGAAGGSRCRAPQRLVREGALCGDGGDALPAIRRLVQVEAAGDAARPGLRVET